MLSDEEMRRRPPSAYSHLCGRGGPLASCFMTDLETAIMKARMARVPVTVSVELGRTECQLGEAVSFGSGDVVCLDREPGSPCDIYVDGVMYGQGELVQVGGDWAVRILTLVQDGLSADEAPAA